MKLMTEIEAKEFISIELRRIQDQSFAHVLRKLLFGNPNTDWNEARRLIAVQCPETQNENWKLERVA